MIRGLEIAGMVDYSQGVDGLPKSNVLKFLLKEGGTVILRPSGTEPKLKLYLSLSARNRQELALLEQRTAEAVERMMEGC